MKVKLRAPILFLGLLVAVPAAFSRSGSETPSGQSMETLRRGEFLAAYEEAVAEGEGVLLDVRTPGEVAGGSAPAAVNYDFFSADFDAFLDGLDREKTYFLYCRSGNRSGKTLEKMKTLGFLEAYDISGGWSGNSAALAELR